MFFSIPVKKETIHNEFSTALNSVDPKVSLLHVQVHVCVNFFFSVRRMKKEAFASMASTGMSLSQIKNLIGRVVRNERAAPQHVTRAARTLQQFRAVLSKNMKLSSVFARLCFADGPQWFEKSGWF